MVLGGVTVRTKKCPGEGCRGSVAELIVRENDVRQYKLRRNYRRYEN